MLGRNSAITDKLPPYPQLELTNIAHKWDHSKDWGKEQSGKDREVPGV